MVIGQGVLFPSETYEDIQGLEGKSQPRLPSEKMALGLRDSGHQFSNAANYLGCSLNTRLWVPSFPSSMSILPLTLWFFPAILFKRPWWGFEMSGEQGPHLSQWRAGQGRDPNGVHHPPPAMDVSVISRMLASAYPVPSGLLYYLLW